DVVGSVKGRDGVRERWQARRGNGEIRREYGDKDKGGRGGGSGGGWGAFLIRKNGIRGFVPVAQHTMLR
ncbi:hypothetical protein MTO96_038589, partial [Rhipicephalus appendiculatus]